MWDLLGPGLEPVSPALAGGFLTSEPPGKPLRVLPDEVVGNASDGGRRGSGLQEEQMEAEEISGEGKLR